MKKIVVTTDLSEKSTFAFPTARKIATAFSSEITLLAVVEDPAQAAMLYAMDYPVVPGPEIQDQLRAKVKRDLEDMRNEYFEGLPVTLKILEADSAVHQTIINFARDQQSDLVVMATHGRTGITRILIGSVTERVIRECSCPILTVPVHDEQG